MTHIDRSILVPALTNAATRLRIDSARSTSEAGSGHPTSCFSAADTVAALFFAEMRFDPKNPHHPGSDRFVLSKGHAAPILYAAWAEAGAVDRSELLKLRRLDSDREGHPTPRLSFGDGESAEGAVWEAANVGAADGLDTLCGITDVNGLGQSRPTMWNHHMEQFERRWSGFGWNAIVIDGHDMNGIVDALAQARNTTGR